MKPGDQRQLHVARGGTPGSQTRGPAERSDYPSFFNVLPVLDIDEAAVVLPAEINVHPSCVDLKVVKLEPLAMLLEEDQDTHR